MRSRHCSSPVIRRLQQFYSVFTVEHDRTSYGVSWSTIRSFTADHNSLDDICVVETQNVYKICKINFDFN